MKILDKFEIKTCNTDYDYIIRKINTILIDRNIDADNIISINLEDEPEEAYYTYVVIYKREFKSYDADPRVAIRD